MTENNAPVTLSVASGSKTLVIQKGDYFRKFQILDTTKVVCSESGELSVGSMTFTLGDNTTGRTTLKDVQDAADFLREIAGTNRTAQFKAEAKPKPVYGTVRSSSQSMGNSSADRQFAMARKHYERAADVAGFVERLAYGFTVLSIVGGLLIAFTKNPNCDYYCDFGEKYQNFWSGTLVGLYGALFMLAIAMLAAYVKGRAAENGARPTAAS